MTPPCRSVAIPIAVVTDPNATVWMKMPGIRKFTYDSPGTVIAPPNTKRNINTKMIGWMLLNTSTSGVRSIDSRLRHATTTPSVTAITGVTRCAEPPGSSDVRAGYGRSG